MSTKPFRLPRKPLAPVNPRLVSKRLREAAKAEPEPEIVPSALDTWEPGFAAADAMAELARLGATLPGQPQEEPDSPHDVTRLSSDDLGKLHAQFAGYAVYLGARVALARVAAAEEKAYLDHVAAEIRLRKTGTVQDKAAKTINDARFISAEQRKIIAEARYDLLKARMEGYRDIRDALSREISRRQGDREMNVH